jgi:hypothetical protein
MSCIDISSEEMVHEADIRMSIPFAFRHVRYCRFSLNKAEMPLTFKDCISDRLGVTTVG